MKNILILSLSILLLLSCEDSWYYEFPEIEYKFKMDGKAYQDSNGYYHLSINPSETQQTLHKFGAYITNIDKYGLPSQVIWNCDAFWSIDLFNNNTNVPIVNGTSLADPLLDSVFCMMAPIGLMIGDTIEIRGIAHFEEGDISLQDSFQIIFE